ncbi:hypothetical protein LSUE1_G002103 [Lachnellula suecica]|uniref:Uncharacterized protein n=1 Tax=Lachnellula suecica TaxID=602035 RepID=A0A8T9C8Z9_9HELO|nr:hypothetical protein LSUE1_G002103 [Lachnellula suecica]
MDSKQPIPPPAFNDADTAPPSYTDSINTSSYYSAQIRSQLSDLTHQISSLQTQKSLLSHAQDEKILALLTNQIQTYLSDFANSGLKRGTLILVPANGLSDKNAQPSGYDFKNPDEYDVVNRVRSKEDESSGDMMYWGDEAMAQRLAGYLRPPPDLRKVELPPRIEQVVMPQQESKSKGFWGRKKSITKPALAPVERQVPTSSTTKMPSEASGDRVVMDVKADEVVFRTESDMGIYGTERGWGIVLKLKVIFAEDRR